MKLFPHLSRVSRFLVFALILLLVPRSRGSTVAITNLTDGFGHPLVNAMTITGYPKIYDSSVGPLVVPQRFTIRQPTNLTLLPGNWSLTIAGWPAGLQFWTDASTNIYSLNQCATNLAYFVGTNRGGFFTFAQVVTNNQTGVTLYGNFSDASSNLLQSLMNSPSMPFGTPTGNGGTVNIATAAPATHSDGGNGGTVNIAGGGAGYANAGSGGTVNIAVGATAYAGPDGNGGNVNIGISAGAGDPGTVTVGNLVVKGAVNLGGFTGTITNFYAITTNIISGFWVTNTAGNINVPLTGYGINCDGFYYPTNGLNGSVFSPGRFSDNFQFANPQPQGTDLYHPWYLLMTVVGTSPSGYGQFQICAPGAPGQDVFTTTNHYPIFTDPGPFNPAAATWFASGQWSGLPTVIPMTVTNIGPRYNVTAFVNGVCMTNILQ